jgi:phosphate butyryltransferase
MNSDFEKILLSLRPKNMRTVSVANAIDANVLASLMTAHKMGFINAILCGNENEIKSVAQQNNIDISEFKIIHCDNEFDAAKTSVELVRSGHADILMKGLIHTADILRAVLNRDTGIRGNDILSHVSVLYSPKLQRTLFLTDIAMVPYPDLDKKIQLVKNAVSVAHHMGIKQPLVAPLCAVETLNPAMQSTLDADALQKMNKNGEISDCIISGPISFDIAVSQDAARIKQYNGPIQGNADILLFDNIEAGNNTIKAMVQFGDWIFGGIIVGATAPVIINSRSDSDISKLFSIACACSM